MSCKDTFSDRCRPETHTRIWTHDEPLKSEFSVKRNLFEKKTFAYQQWSASVEHKINQFRAKNEPVNVKSATISR